jgi:ubiquinone/menaquinone biosynthesis C-methylase UbiE
MTKKFKERFDAIAESYDADRGEFSLMDALLIVGSSGKVRGCKVLDIGTGTGIVAFEFAKRVGEDGEVIGIDISEPMLQRAREKARKGGISNIKFDVGSFTNIPLASESIDVVVSSTALHHVEPQEKPKAFSEM